MAFLIAFLLGLGLGHVWTLLVVGAIACLAVAGLLVIRLPAVYELWARYRGLEVRLFSTTDQAQLGRITRALTRALEAQRTDF